MSRNRLYVDQPLQANSEIKIGGNQAHYIGRVLRLRRNDELSLFDGCGGEHPGSIRSITKNSCQISVGAHVERGTESALSIHLLQGISRGERMDLVMQKATELGVAKITPIITENSVIRLEKKRAEKRLQRWQAIVAKACEQCGRNILPIIDEPIHLRSWLDKNDNPDGARLVMRPGAKRSLGSINAINTAVTVLIGPEGGLSDDEYDLAATVRFEAINFGPRILRTETAAIAVVAALQALCGDLASVKRAL